MKQIFKMVISLSAIFLLLGMSVGEGMKKHYACPACGNRREMEGFYIEGKLVVGALLWKVTVNVPGSCRD